MKILREVRFSQSNKNKEQDLKKRVKEVADKKSLKSIAKTGAAVGAVTGASLGLVAGAPIFRSIRGAALGAAVPTAGVYVYRKLKKETEPEQKRNRRIKNFSDSLKIKVTRRETMKGDERLGADGGSSRKFVTNEGYEFDDPVVTHWKGSTIVGYTNRKTGEIVKDPGKLFQQELDKIKKRNK